MSILFASPITIVKVVLQGECLLPALVGKFYDQQSYTDVAFQLSDGSSVQVRWFVIGSQL